MFANYYADMLVTLMLGWTRGLTDWVWNIIRLGDGSAGHRFLTWFSGNWIKIVVVMILVGVMLDWFIWLVRWRPYWLWFGKKRRILNDTHEPAYSSRMVGRSANNSHRPEGPRFTSKALPRTQIPQPNGDFEEDELFDVVSPAISQAATPAHQKIVNASVNRYIDNEPRNNSAHGTKEKHKVDELDWFD